MSKYICINCGRVYKSKKKNSKFCSKECQTNYNSIPYNCDYCGKEITITRSEHSKLINGTKTHKYCSRECADKGLITSEIKTCECCGKQFSSFKSSSNSRKYCSRDCYNKQRSKMIKYDTKQCPVCNTIFKTYSHDQIYCSSECCGKSQRKRFECLCSYCGKPFEKKLCEKSENNYCSILCRKLDQQWNSEDVIILEKNYGKIPTKEITPLLSKPYSETAIKSEAGRRDLCKSRLWSQEEINILVNMYPNNNMSEVLNALPNRTLPSIMGKVRHLGLTSYYYNQRIYSEEDEEFLRNNYLTMDNDELGKCLSRNPNAIQQRLLILDLHRPLDLKATCYKNIAMYIRAQNATWRNHIFQKNNYTCYLSNKERDVVIHHCRGFNLLLQESMDILNFEIKDDFDTYEVSELDKLYDCFSELQDGYGEYVCINKDIHKLFHDNYGYGNNTMQQWIDFEGKYKNGYYQ